MKRIVICCDGTWDDVNDNTNVRQISDLITEIPNEQVRYYHPGVGAVRNILVQVRLSFFRSIITFIHEMIKRII